MPDAQGRYSKTPESLVVDLWPLIEGHHLNILGGCCGTTDAHIALMARAIQPMPGLYISPLTPGIAAPAATVPSSSPLGPVPGSSDKTAEDNASRLFTAILNGKSDDAATATREAIADGAIPQDLINGQMIRAMSEVGQQFQDGKAFVPQLLMAGRAMKTALELLKPMMAGTAATSLGKVVIGTVKGDLHDIGKNLVASMLEGCGFEVVNIGIDVSADKFIEAVKENQPDILCMSALLTTTMGYMKEVIDALEKAGIRQQVKVMVGGAPVTQGFADEIGADGYSDNANSAVTVAKQLLRQR
jgi:corrinoid protein of di/trimethylamine methyltransferase